MAKKNVRDNEYFLERLKRESPTVFQDLQAGKYRTVAKALLAAGIKKERTRFHELMNAWKKASASEQNDFRTAIGCVPASTTLVTPPLPLAPKIEPFAVNGKLQPAAITSIQRIMTLRDLKMGELMHELGRKRLNPSVGLAINQGAHMKQDLIDDLEKWVRNQPLSARPS